MVSPDNDKNSKEWFESWFESRLYDLMYAHRDEVEARLFLSRLLEYLSPDGKSEFLDLACGTGRHARYVHSQGFRVTGIDLSQRKIAIASEYAEEGLEFYIQDMRKPFRRNYYNYVLNLFTSFGYFDNPEDNNRVIRSVKSSLKEGGILVIDFMNPAYVREHLISEEEKQFGEWNVHIYREIDSGRLIKKMDWSNGSARRIYEEKVSLFTLSDFNKMLNAHGFNILEVFGNYELGQFDDQRSDRLILISKC